MRSADGQLEHFGRQRPPSHKSAEGGAAAATARVPAAGVARVPWRRQGVMPSRRLESSRVFGCRLAAVAVGAAPEARDDLFLLLKLRHLPAWAERGRPSEGGGWRRRATSRAVTAVRGARRACRVSAHTRHSACIRSDHLRASASWSSEAIRSTQRQSVVIRGNQKRSEAISGHPRQSEAL